MQMRAMLLSSGRIEVSVIRSLTSLRQRSSSSSRETSRALCGNAPHRPTRQLVNAQCLLAPRAPTSRHLRHPTRSPISRAFPSPMRYPCRRRRRRHHQLGSVSSPTRDPLAPPSASPSPSIAITHRAPRQLTTNL